MMEGFDSKANLDFTQDADDLIKTSRESLFLRILGWPKHQVEERIYSEIKMVREANFSEKLQNHYDIRNKLILDVGCGLGGFVVQLGLKRAKVIGVEPSKEYSMITQKRIEKYNIKDRCQCITAAGDPLPFSDDTFDFVICLSVLEHANNPNSVVKEIVRVTKPNGIIHIETANYFSFWDAHYRILWFPLMPKKLAEFYLRVRGRNPYFFENYITYTTFFSLQRFINKLNNLSDLNKSIIEEKLRDPKLVQSPRKRFVINACKALGLNKTFFLQVFYWSQFLRNIVKTNTLFILKKLNGKANKISKN